MDRIRKGRVPTRPMVPSSLKSQDGACNQHFGTIVSAPDLLDASSKPQDRVGQRGKGRSRWKARELSASSSSEQNRSASLERSRPEGLNFTAENTTAEVGDTTECVQLVDNRDIIGEAAETDDNVACASRNTETEKEEAIMKRLLELELSGSEHDMPELDQERNKQEQSDEVVALQAIFGEDFVVLEANEGLSQTRMISIHVEVSTNLNVFMKLQSYLNNTQNSIPRLPVPEWAASSDDSDLNVGRPVDKLHVCTLQFLPPIHLVYRLPRSYPSHSPPTFILSACWLNHRMLSSLCQVLDTLWEQQAGEVVIYSWAEWLRSSCLSHLGITDQLDLDICEKDGQDKRALSTPDVDIPWLVHYNEEQENNEFLKAVHTCFICFTEQLGKDFVRLACKHNFCYECMLSYAKINVKEGTVKKLQCPDTSCKSVIPPSILKHLLEEDEFNRWECLVLQKTLDSMVDVVYCPRCEIMCIEDEDHHAQCSGCFFSFCSLCKGSRHVGQDCMSTEARLRILQERQEVSKSGEARRRREQDIVNELLSMKYMQQETKQCPSCKMAISKVEGCNKVTCANCGQYICYRCNKAIEGYDHFREGCVLFDQSEIERWEYQMNVRQGAHNDASEHWRPCPNCRQLNLKIQNNNHIYCVACQNHFCALCRRMVRRSSEHYGVGPNKCRQHSSD